MIAKDIDIYQALQELRLNIRNQFGRTTEFLTIDLAMIGIVMEFTSNRLKKEGLI